MRALPLAKALAQRGHQIELLLPPWSWPQDAGREWDENGVHIHHIALPPTWPLLFQLEITRRLLRRILQFKPDIVHCFKPKAYAGLVAWAVWWLRKLGLIRPRLVVDADDWEGPGGWNEIEDYSVWQKRFFAWQERWGLCHGDALTVASRALQTIVWSLGVPPNRVHYLPNGIDAKQMARGLKQEEGCRIRERYDLGNAPVLLLYTRFFEFHVARVLDIWRQVRSQFPNARLMVVGQGLFGEEKELLRLASESDLSADLVYVGWVSEEQLAGYFAAADVALYPFDDTLINRTKCAVKLLDLMAAGVPIVADAVGQNAEYIQQEWTGLLAPPGDTEQFAASVVRLLQNPSLRMRLGQQARQHVAATYAWEKLAKIAERAYTDSVTS